MIFNKIFYSNFFPSISCFCYLLFFPLFSCPFLIIISISINIFVFIIFSSLFTYSGTLKMKKVQNSIPIPTVIWEQVAEEWQQKVSHLPQFLFRIQSYSVYTFFTCMTPKPPSPSWNEILQTRTLLLSYLQNIICMHTYIHISLWYPTKQLYHHSHLVLPWLLTSIHFNLMKSSFYIFFFIIIIIFLFIRVTWAVPVFFSSHFNIINIIVIMRNSYRTDYLTNLSVQFVSVYILYFWYLCSFELFCLNFLYFICSRFHLYFLYTYFWLPVCVPSYFLRQKHS